MTDRYAVIGQPVAHSKSPLIHAAFARQTGQDLSYERIPGRLQDVEQQFAELAAAGFSGLNVTLPFKERALRASTTCSDRASVAGAANTLLFSAEGVHADNTDGIGLLRDLLERQGHDPAGRRVLVLGAGGAVQGILQPLLARQPDCLHLRNRTPERAAALMVRFRTHTGRSALDVQTWDALPADGPYDLVINGTSAGLGDAWTPLPQAVFGPDTLAYDLAYRPDGAPTHFLAQALACRVTQAVDGLGMLVEQAAEAFRLWRGVLPDTSPVLAALRSPHPAPL